MAVKMTLKSKVLSVFGETARFAEAMGWPESKALAIISGSREPDNAQMTAMALCLGITDSEEFMDIFLVNSP